MSKVALEIAPLTEAVRRMDRKMPIARALTSAEWANVPLALRERAFWTARFAKADVLQVMHDAIGDRLSMTSRESVPGRGPVTMSRDNFITELRDRLVAAGYVPPKGKEGTIEDMLSTGRLGLIYDMNTQMAAGYARWKGGQRPGALFGFPAQELYRAEDRMVPRNWIERWRGAGGQLFDGGRMIAAKDDPIWTEISAFGTPWPPFDFNSGMRVIDISRAEAERLGVIAPGQRVEPPQVEFNANLEKSVEGYAPGIVDDLVAEFEGRLRIEENIARLAPEPVPVAMPAPMPSEQAVELLTRGVTLTDGQGELRRLSWNTLSEHRSSVNMPELLPMAIQTLATGTKHTLTERILYTQVFEGDPGSVVTVSVSPAGEVRRIRRKRKGGGRSGGPALPGDATR